MDANLAGGGPTSGVRVFTVFVLSGSLFLLIYNVGRRRMNMRSSHPVRETSPVIANPSSLRGYFSHLREKSSSRHRNPSLTVALEPSASSRHVEGTDNSSDSTDQAGASSGVARDIVETNLSGVPIRRGNVENEPPMFNSNYSGTPPASFSSLDRSGPTTGYEGQMIECMRRSSIASDSGESSCSYVVQRRKSSSSFFGDMSQLETVVGRVKDGQRTPNLRRVSFKEDFQLDDSGRQRSLLPQSVPISPREQFLKPLLYVFIWCVLSYSFHVYSSTGWGARMSRFPAPFLKSSVLFLMQSVISSCMLRWPRNKVFVMPWNTFMLIVVPIATAAALDRDLQDASVFLVALGFPMVNKPSGILEYAYMMFSSVKDASLETVWDARIQSKGYVPLCVFLFALAFRLESRSVTIVVSIATIAVGFILAVTKGTKFGVLSLKESSVGPFISGFRWAAIQVLLQKRELGLITPVVTMRALSPAMAMVAALISLVAEPWDTLSTTEDFFDTLEHAFKSCGHIIVGALLGTAVALAEFVVIYHTSALTLIILGMLKDLSMVVPRMFHDDDFSDQNMFGVVVFSIGLVCLMWFKYQKLQRLQQPWDDALPRPCEDTWPISSRLLTDRWPGSWPRDFPSVASRIQQVRGVLERAQDGGKRLSRKLIALWELVS